MTGIYTLTDTEMHTLYRHGRIHTIATSITDGATATMDGDGAIITITTTDGDGVTILTTTHGDGMILGTTAAAGMA